MRPKCCGICRHNQHLFDDTLDGYCTVNPPQYVPVQTRLARETWGREWVYPKVAGNQMVCASFQASEDHKNKSAAIELLAKAEREEQTK